MTAVATTTATPLAVRSVLLWFSRFQEGKLRENYWKPGWQEESLGELSNDRDEEAVEGIHAMVRLRVALETRASQEEIQRLAVELIKELADEANYCAMEATKAAALAGLELPDWDHRGMISRSPVFLERDYIDAVENTVAAGQLIRYYMDGSLPSTLHERRVAIRVFDEAVRGMGRFANATPQA